MKKNNEEENQKRTNALIEKNTKCSEQDLLKMGYTFLYGLGKATKVYFRETKKRKYFIYWNFQTEQITGVQNKKIIQ